MDKKNNKIPKFNCSNKKHESNYSFTNLNNYKDFELTYAKGWKYLYKPILAKIDEINENRNDKNKVVLLQIKEKFGGLRIYVNNGTEELKKMILEAEKQSYNVCDECGTTENVGIASAGYLKTKCFNCAEKRYGKIFYRNLANGRVTFTRNSDRKKFLFNFETKKFEPIDDNNKK